jgi:hypothetical protein
MIIICFNLSNHIKYLITLEAVGFSGEWYINLLARFPLLKAAQNLEKYYWSKARHLGHKILTAQPTRLTAGLGVV